MKIILKLLVIFLPWKLKRLCLNYFWKYQIHPKAHIGFSFIYPKIDNGRRSPNRASQCCYTP